MPSDDLQTFDELCRHTLMFMQITRHFSQFKSCIVQSVNSQRCYVWSCSHNFCLWHCCFILLL